MEPHLSAAQQYFPTYKLNPERFEIGLREYDLAAKALEADHKSLTAAAGIVLFVLGAFATAIGSNVGTAFQWLEQRTGDGWWALPLVVAFMGLLAVHYFSLLQRSATYAARKIVVLRRLLGLDYGNIETVLPSNRLEGANEPFSIAMFPGWKSLPALPVLVIMFLAFVLQMAFVSVLAPDGRYYQLIGLSLTPQQAGVIAGGATALLLGAAYRFALFDTFETLRLAVGRLVGFLVHVPLKRRIGHVLYRMRLAVFEAQRLKIPLTDLHPMLVFIEDRRFFEHGGNSPRAAAAALWRYYRYRAVSGGSTIYQQLVRSNVLSVLNRTIRRKILEWILAPWIAQIFPRKQGLDAYLCSVRFAGGVTGIVEAIRHYFPKHRLSDPLGRHQCFLLVERLSNVSATFAPARVNRIAQAALGKGLLVESDFVPLTEAYRRLVAHGLMSAPDGAALEVSPREP